MKSVQLVMVMALLFCIFLCPQGADAVWDECSVSQPSIECQDMCDCSEPVEHTDFCADSCVYEYRDDNLLTIYCNFDHIDWTYVILSFEEPQQPVCRTGIMANLNSHSFTVRHLDSIILRV